jgi:hypothetical protein
MDSTVTPSDRSAVPLGETAEQKMARLELAISTLQDAPSSHGEPLLPTSWTKPLFVIYLVLSGSGLTLLTQLDASTKVIAIASFVVATLGALLGLSSSGIRKAGTAAVALLLVAGSLSLTGCGHISPYERQILDCGEKALAAQAQDLLPVVAPILYGGDVDWEASLDRLIIAGGQAAVCAIRVSLAQLEHVPANADGGSVMSNAPAVSARGYYYLASRGLQPRLPAPARHQ